MHPGYCVTKKDVSHRSQKAENQRRKKETLIGQRQSEDEMPGKSPNANLHKTGKADKSARNN